MDKRCCRCKETKPQTEFNRKKENSDGLQSFCRLCQNVKAQQHYKDNKAYYLNRNKQRFQEISLWLSELKKQLGCRKCRENDPACLDFHHTTGKDFSLSLAAGMGFSRDRIQKELDKCEVLCSNCHRKLHRDQKLGRGVMAAREALTFEAKDRPLPTQPILCSSNG